MWDEDLDLTRPGGDWVPPDELLALEEHTRRNIDHCDDRAYTYIAL